MMIVGSIRPWPARLVGPAAAGFGIILGLAVGLVAVWLSPLAALGVVVALASGLLILRQPDVGLYCLIGLAYLLPFAVVPLRLGAQLTALEALLGLTLGATLLRALARQERPRVSGPTWLLVALLGLDAVSFLLSSPYAGGSDVTRRVLKLALAMLVFPLSLRLVRSDAQINRLLAALCLLSALESATGLALYLLPHPTTIRLLSALGPLGYPTGDDVLRFLPGPNNTYSDVLRATGTSIDPNVFGGVLMLGAAVAITQCFASRPVLPRWLLLGCASMTVAAMVISQSRASWVGLAAGLLALATVRYRRIWLVIIPAALAVALTPFGRGLLGRVLSGFAGQDRAAGMRLDEYHNALEIVRQHPLLGIGFGAAPSLDLAPGVSSIYLTVAETAGLLALGVYLTLLAWLLLDGLHALMTVSDPAHQGALASLLTLLVAALVAGLFDHYFAGTAFPHAVALFWLGSALLYRATKLTPTDRSPWTSPAELVTGR
jgi:polysaccharide biosynthesis protein PslJ